MKAIEFLLSVPLSPRPGLHIHYSKEKPLAQPMAGVAMLQADQSVPVIPLGDHGYIIGVVFSRRTGRKLINLPCDAPLAAGAVAIRKAGGTVLGESEASCVIYGMPKAAKEAGGIDSEFDLSEMAAAIVGSLHGRVARAS